MLVIFFWKICLCNPQFWKEWSDIDANRVDSLLDGNKHVSLNIHLLVYFSWNRCFAFPETRVSRHSRIQDSEVFPFNWMVSTIHVRCIWTIYINKITLLILLFFIKTLLNFTFSTLRCYASKQILYLALYWIF